MGSSLSCGCDSRQCLIEGQCPGTAIFRFWAEIFKLSSDRSHWSIINPSLLSVTVSEISRKRSAVHLIVKANSTLLLDQLIDSSNQVTRVSSCFAYWYFQGEIYGINVVSAEDCDRFCRLTSQNEQQKYSSSQKPSSNLPTSISVQISQIFCVENGTVRHKGTQYVDCKITLNYNCAVFEVNGKDLFINLLESVMVIGEVKERLYLSEPGRAFAIECADARTLRFLLTKLLTFSSFLFSGTTNVANAAHCLQKQITRANEKVSSLLRSISMLSECELAQNLDEELEMTQLKLFALKYRLAALCDVAFPPPSDVLSKISLRTLRQLGSFGGAAICSLHLHFLCKTHFKMNSAVNKEELTLNVKTLEDMKSMSIAVLLPSGSVLHLNETSDNIDGILHKVCESAKLNPANHYIVRDGYRTFRIMEREYRIQKNGRNLGITICAREDSGTVKAEVRAVRDRSTFVSVGDVVISVDDKAISALNNAEQVESLLRSATSLVLRRKVVEILPRKSRQSPKVTKRSKSMDKITVPQSSSEHTHDCYGSTKSSPSRSSHSKYSRQATRAMSKSSYESNKRQNEPAGFTSQFADIAEEQLLNTISELVATEENFVRDVKKLVDQYLKPTNLPILETADRLLRIQHSFFLSLIDAAGDTANSRTVSQQQLRDSLIRLSALFINKCNKFKIYSEYSAAYLRFQQNTKARNEIETQLEKMNISREQSESAQSLLIKPIQRVLKYPLFLRQIKDNCLEGTVERQQACQALTRMHALAEYVNEMQRLTEQYGPLIEEISTKNGAASRMNLSQLLMFAHINWLNCLENRSKPVACVAFVFTSLIFLYCPSLSKNKTRIYRILPIAEIEVNENHSSTADQYLFVLIHIGSPREPVYHLSCCQAEIKNHFIKSIRKAAASIVKEKRPISGSSQSDGGYGSERHIP